MIEDGKAMRKRNMFGIVLLTVGLSAGQLVRTLQVVGPLGIKRYLLKSSILIY